MSCIQAVNRESVAVLRLSHEDLRRRLHQLERRGAARQPGDGGGVPAGGEGVLALALGVTVGVAGQLHAGAFRYQSATDHLPVTELSGRFAFVPGSMRQPSGEVFEIAVGPVPCEPPAYLY